MIVNQKSAPTMRYSSLESVREEIGSANFYPTSARGDSINSQKETACAISVQSQTVKTKGKKSKRKNRMERQKKKNKSIID